MFFNPFEAGTELKNSLRNGETCIGAFLKIPAPDMVEVLASTRLQFVVADAEHGPIDPETCQQMVRAADAARTPLLARIGETASGATVNRFLDTGIAGVMLPRVSSVDSAHKEISSLLHPPYGSRGLAGGRWARYGSREPLGELVEEIRAALVVVVQIEETEAIDHLDALLRIDEIDVFFIGPTDLSASMGLLGQKTEQVATLINETLQRIVDAGRTAGILASSPTELETYRGAGARYLLLNGESIVRWGVERALDKLSSAT